MRHNPGARGSATFPASEAERASIRALKNWLLAKPGDNPLEDQIVRLRLAAAIADLSSGKPQPKAAARRRVGKRPGAARA